MSALTIYGIAAGSLIGVLLILHHISWLNKAQERVARWVIRHLVYNYILGKPRHVFGEWSIAAVLFHLVYISTTIFCTLYPQPSTVNVGRQSGALILINMAFLYSNISLDTLADWLGITRQDCYCLHRVVGWMFGVLVVVHACCEISQGMDAALTAEHMAEIVVCRSG